VQASRQVVNNSFPQKLSANKVSSVLMSTSASSTNAGLTDIGTTESKSKSESTKMISSWREKIEISIAKSRKVRGGNFVQIATVDPKTLEPRCRTVVFRGFLKTPNSTTKSNNLPCIMKMITDKRSNKFQEVSSAADDTADGSTPSRKNSAEMVWWFSKSSEQYRIRGQLKFVGGDEEDKGLLQSRKEQWGNLSDMAREQFYWVDPGLDYDVVNGHEVGIPIGGRGEDGKVLPPPDSFLLMLLYPTRCDYLKLGDNYRQVDDVVEGDGDGDGEGEGNEWLSNRVNP
jgi:pyridoxamine 5'-phosphate oxidase